MVPLSDPTIQDRVRSILIALSRRGRRLVRNGGESCVANVDETVVIPVADQATVAFINASGWLTAIDDRTSILSPAGRTQVRSMRSGPSPAEAGAGRSSQELPRIPSTQRQRQSASGSLAWLRARRNKYGEPLLSAQAYDAAARLASDFHRAGMSPRLTVDWEAIPRSRDESRGAPGGAREQRDGTVAAGDRVRQALAAVPTELVGLVVDVCLFDLGLQEAEERVGAPQRSSHFLLKIALNELARHYGLLPRLGGSWDVPRRAQHWGAAGYRPKI